jgi:hypothetical protein
MAGVNIVNIKQYCVLIEETSNAFRCGYEGKANELLVSVFDGLPNAMASLNQEELSFVQGLIPILAEAQKTGDMIYVSDILQYEILPRILKSSA